MNNNTKSVQKKSGKTSNGIYSTIKNHKLLALASVVALFYIGKKVANSYVDSQFKDRQELLSQATGEGTYNLDDVLKRFSFSEKFEISHNINKMDRLMDKQSNIDNLVKYINTHQQELVELTSTNYEQQGVVLNNNILRLKPITSYALQMAQYVVEIRAHDFIHKNELFKNLEANPALFLGQATSSREISTVMSMINLYEQKYNSGSNFTTMAVSASPAEIDKINNMTAEGLSNMEQRLKLSSVWSFSYFLNQDGLWCRYHTHPKEDLSYMPSGADETNSLAFGPTLLFSQRNDTLRAYLMRHNTSKKIYEQKILRK